MKNLFVSFICIYAFIAAADVYGQSIRYISFYPVPGATHSQLSVSKKAVLGAADGAVVEFGNPSSPNGLAVSKFEAGRIVITTFNDAGGNTDLVVGSINNKDTENTGTLKAGADVSVVNSVSKVKVLEADGTLSIKGMYWPGKGGIGANKDGAEDWENCPEGSKIEWQQLRLGGDDYYRMYLTCGAPNVMEEPVCDHEATGCTEQELVIGSPVNESCRCMPDCTKIFINGQTTTFIEEGGLCCLEGQIVKREPQGKYCTYPFNEGQYWINAVAQTTCTPNTNQCKNASSVCKPIPSTVKYYKGGSVGSAGSNKDAYKVCGERKKKLGIVWCDDRVWAWSKLHNSGWSGGSEFKIYCDEGQYPCDLICNRNQKTCDKICIKKDFVPTFQNGSKYEYSTCYTEHDNIGCDNGIIDYNGYMCGDTTAYVGILQCKGT